MRHAVLIMPVLLSACAPQADGPRLLPTAQILAEPVLPAHARAAASDPAPVETAAQSRAEALRRRADALRGPVVDPALRDRAEMD